MPVSLKRTPFAGAPPVKLIGPHARILAVLVPSADDDPVFDWPVVNRAQLGVRAGYTAISGSVTRALDGILPGNTTSGTPHPGLLTLGLVEKFSLDIEGTAEVNYRITAAGIAAYKSHLAATGGLPPLRDRAKATNLRYMKDSS